MKSKPTQKQITILLILLLTIKHSKEKRHFEPRYTKDYLRQRNREQQPLAEMEEYLFFDEFCQYHDDKSNPKWETRYPIFKITRQYYKTSDSIINPKEFLKLSLDYIVYKFANLHFDLSLKTIHDLKAMYKKVLTQEFERHKDGLFNFRHCYDFLLGSQYVLIFHMKVKLQQLPEEFQHKLRELHDDKTDSQFREMFNGFEHPNYEMRDHKLLELERRHNERYGYVEWSKDGRRVIDDDYDDLEPRNERHGYKFRRKKKFYLSEGEIDQLLEMDL